MMKVLQAVDGWAAEFECAHVYTSPHGPIVPKVNIGAIQGGAPFRPNYIRELLDLCRLRTPLRCVQSRCSMSSKPSEQLGIECEIEMYASKMGYQAKGVEPLSR